MATHARKEKEPGQSQSVAARWSDTLAEWGYTPIANVFLERYGQLEITPTEAMLICHLMSFKWTEDAPYPSVPRLAKLMRCSERYIRKMCANLESVGLIKRIGREGTSNAFDLSGLFKKLEAIVIEQKLEAARKAKAETAAKRRKKTTMLAPAEPTAKVSAEPHGVSVSSVTSWAGGVAALGGGAMAGGAMAQLGQAWLPGSLGAAWQPLPSVVRQRVQRPLQSTDAEVEG